MAERDLAKQIAAAKVVRDTLAFYSADDETLRDCVEGQTDLHGAIESVMRSIIEDEMQVTGLDAMIKAFAARKDRLEIRIERQKKAIEAGLLAGALKTLTLPFATLTLRDVPAKVLVTDEKKIPWMFWSFGEPKLNKMALNEVVKDGHKIPGALLGNGSVSLSVRRS